MNYVTNSDLVSKLKKCRSLLKAVLAFSILLIIMFVVFYLLKIFKVGEKLTNKFITISNNLKIRNNEFEDSLSRFSSNEKVDLFNSSSGVLHSQSRSERGEIGEKEGIVEFK